MAGDTAKNQHGKDGYFGEWKWDQNAEKYETCDDIEDV